MAHRYGWLVGVLAVMALAAALALIAAGGPASLAQGDILYVDAGATGADDGSSWVDAYTDLQDALEAAGTGDQIWVAAGIYKPTDGTDRAISFQMVNGVAIYGGFAGTETEVGQRDWPSNVTVLSGDIGTPGDASDNSYHVFYHPGGLDSSATLDGFTISGGNADGGSYPANSGGGMVNHDSSPALSHVTFAGNWATFGGGMFNQGSSPALIDVAFTGNEAHAGGGMHNLSASPGLTNCIFQDNMASEGGAIYNDHSAPELTNCTLAGNTGQAGGGGMLNLSSAPVLVNCTFWGNSAGDGGAIYNWDSSPELANCILWGDAPNEILDYDEASTPAVTYSDVQGGHAGQGNLDADPLFADPAGGDFHLRSGSPCVDAGTNAAGLPAYDFEGHDRIRDGDGDGVATVDMGVDEKRVLYVDAGATGASDGTTWADAFTGLQSALDEALAGDEIWVAAGIYRPMAQHGGSGDRYRSFQMANGVAIYGGFDPSVGDGDWEDRDWVNKETILSGDIGIVGDSADNSYHVFFHPAGAGLDGTAILDGFTVTGGNANGLESPDNEGGGMYNNGSSPALANCTFIDNSAVGSGGGMRNTGGALPTLTGCAFAGNTADTEGGGMHNDGSSPVLSGCTFSGNTADAGGGIYNGSNSLPELINCTFAGNSARSGGGMHNDGSSPVLVNCTFWGNSAIGNGGGLRNTRGSAPTLTNCTFQGNTATNGGAIHNYIDSSPTLTNCILWGDSKPEIDDSDGSTPIVTYSDVDGGYLYPGEGNINADPLFVDATNGNLHLGPGSPCIDRGNNLAPNLPGVDFEEDPRILDGDGDGTATVEMGVDEAGVRVYLPVVLRGY